MRNLHLDFLQRARFCDPTGGFATMGVLMAVGIAGGVTSAVGQQQEGEAKSRMYTDAAGNTDTQAALARQTAETNIMLTRRNMEQNIHSTQIDASMADKNLKDVVAKVRGSQTAAMGAAGVGGGSVTQADIIQDTLAKEKMDEIAIRYNADAVSANITNEGNDRVWGIQNNLNNEVWGLGVQKQQYLAAAKNAKQAGNIQALGTILSTVSSVADSGMQYGSSLKLNTNNMNMLGKSKLASDLKNPYYKYSGSTVGGSTW